MLAGAGCVSTPHEDGLGLPESGVFLIDGDQVARVNDAPWLNVQESPGGTTYTFDWLDLVGAESLVPILVQALADVTIDGENDMDFQYRPDAAGNEGEASADFCLLDLGESNAPGDLLLERARGNGVRIPDISFSQRNASWAVWSAGASPVPIVSYGIGGGIGQFKADLEPGEWGLLMAGMSGIPSTDFRVESNRWEGSFEVDGPARFIVLPPALFRCGAGFTRFEGSTGTSPFAAGGQLEVHDRYGLTVTFRSNDELVEGSDIALGRNEGQLRFGEETVTLRDFSNVWRTTYQPLPGSITIDQWVGSPRWMLAGYSIPHPPQVGLDGGNFTRAAASR